MKRFNKIRGISLLEVMLSLAIIAIIIMLATRYFSTANEAENINNATLLIENGRTASLRYLTITGSLQDVSVENLIKDDLLPPGFGKNPWAGNITIVVAPNDSSKVQITLTDIPKPACDNLLAALNDPTIPIPLNTCRVKSNNLTDYVATFSP